MKTPPIDLAPFRHIYPFTSRYADVNGFRMHYVDEGRGEPVIMLHGNPTWSFYFRELIQGLAGRYRAVAPDHIGCGLSDTPRSCAYAYRLKNRVDDLEALLAHLGLTRDITLVLHDWGGMIGAAYALRDVRRIARLIVLNTAAFLKPGGKPLPLRQVGAHAGPAPVGAGCPRLAAPRWLVAGLVFATVGDIAILYVFELGILGFLVMQICYIAGFLGLGAVRGLRRRWPAALGVRGHLAGGEPRAGT